MHLVRHFGRRRRFRRPTCPVAVPACDHLGDRRSEARLDAWGLMLLLLAGVASFSPTAFPRHYAVTALVMMLLGWRHGLLGAGLGGRIGDVTLSVGLTRADSSASWTKFRAAGYGAQLRGSYMELFVTAISSLPLAIVRARQRAMDAVNLQTGRSVNFCHNLPPANRSPARPK